MHAPPPPQTEPYARLAAVYEWLVPEGLVTPRGSVAAYATVVAQLPPGARVLDCAAGTGQLAVGLASAGFDVVASDASPAMVARTSRLAAAHGVRVPAVACRWEELDGQDWAASFDAVFCVGNSIVHARGRAGRREALRQMAGVLRPGGLLVLATRTWERVRAAGSRLEVADRVVERGGRRGLVVHRWTIAADWDEEHGLELAVALLGASGAVTTVTEQLAFWPFRQEALDEDLAAAGLEPASRTSTDDEERYVVTALLPR